MGDQPVRRDQLRQPSSQAKSRSGKSRSAGNRSRSRYGMVPAISPHCSCSTELARIGSWQSPFSKRSHIRPRSSSTCPGSAALPCRASIPAINASAARRRPGCRARITARSMWLVSPGVGASHSNLRINIRNCAGGWFWQRPRRARSWCPPVLRCCGKWRPRGATSTSTT